MPEVALADIVRWSALAIIFTGVAQNLFYAFQLVVAGRALAASPPVRRSAVLWRRYADLAPPVAILAPAFNEEKTIVESVRSLLALQYASYEVIIINDGSTDNTLDKLIEAFGLKTSSRAFDPEIPHEPIRNLYWSPDTPRLVVVDKENGGKADALNAGINISRAPVFCSMDADSILEQDSLLRAVKPFVDDPSRVVAVGGTVRLANGCSIKHGQVLSVRLPRHPLALLQTVEYLRAFLMARLAWSRIGALTIISGAFGLFRRAAVINAGGYSRGTVGEDMELVVKLHRWMREQKRPYRIAYVPEPVCWTEAPESLATLGRQRARWHRGSLETFFRHFGMFMNPRYGRVGTVGFLNIFIVDVLGPLVELLGYLLMPIFWFLGLLSVEYFLAYLAVTFTFGVTISVLSLALEESQLKRFPNPRDLAVLTLVAVLENLGYRQINNIWRLRGFLQFLTGSSDWGVMTRKGFGSH